MATTEYGDISQRTANYAAKKMLEHARPILVLSKFGQMKPVPKNKADNVKFRRPVPFPISVTPLVEGVTPTSHKTAYEDVSATLQQYGDLAEITDKVHDMNEDPVLNDMIMLSGEQAAETIELITWGILKAGTNKFYANGSDRTAVNTAFSLTKQHAVIRALKAARGRPVNMMLSGSPDTNTTPIEGGYITFCHTDCEHDIRAINGFTPVAQYGSRKPLCAEELGSIQDNRFITSPVLESYPDGGGDKGSMKSTSGTKADVYPMVTIAKEAYGLVPLGGPGAIKPMVLNPGTPSKSDPLGQRGYVAWKTWFTAAVLNESWLAVTEVAVTAL